MAPGGGRFTWIVLAFVLVVFVIVIVTTVATMRTPRFEVSNDGLRIRGNVYGRLIPLSHLRLDAANVVELQTAQNLRPKWKTNGAALPGMKSGWFRLYSGEKALVFITSNTRAAYIPTTDGYSLLLAPNEPDALLQALRDQAR